MIRIKLALLESDEYYLQRIMAVFNSRFADRLEVFSFTDKDAALSILAANRIDVFLASEEFVINVDELPKRCAFAYFAESKSVETLYGERTICKFQKVEIMYKEIISLFSEKSGEVIGYKKGGSNSSNVYAFVSSNGGAGSSSTAAGFAVFLARNGKKVLYLNIENFGSANTFFEADGTYDLGDVLYAIKSNKSNLMLKLEGTVKQDVSGVYFYDSCKLPLDVLEIKEDDIKKLIDELELTNSYDAIIVDMNLTFSPVNFTILKRATNIMMVTDGSRIAMKKLGRVLESLEILDNQNEWMNLKKMQIIFNRMTMQPEPVRDDIQVLGSIPFFGSMDERNLITQISGMNFFQNLL